MTEYLQAIATVLSLINPAICAAMFSDTEGPGTITGVITLSATHSPTGIPLTSLVAVCMAITFTWLILLLTIRFADHVHGGGPVHDIFTRFMGLIVLAMGVQFALTGVRAFMAIQ